MGVELYLRQMRAGALSVMLVCEDNISQFPLFAGSIVFPLTLFVSSFYLRITYIYKTNPHV